MDKARYQAIKSEQLSDPFFPRFVIFDTESGTVVDDAQGYGYKSAQKAYAAWNYKTKSYAELKNSAKTQKTIRKWSYNNQLLTEEIETIILRSLKLSGRVDGPKCRSSIQELLKQNGLTEKNLPFTVDELLRCYQ